jgi:multimeric flavodoxin WrbA
MNAIGIVGSPRRDGNTETLTRHALTSVAAEGITVELLSLAGLDIRPCTACDACRSEEMCPIEDDFWPVYVKMKRAQAIILASPVYYGSATALMKALMERAGYVSRTTRAFAGKVGGPLVVARRAGKNFTLAQLTFWFQILGCYIPGATYWTVGIGRDRGEVARDDEGLATAWTFGKNVALLLKKLHGTDSGPAAAT